LWENYKAERSDWIITEAKAYIPQRKPVLIA
jgi:hypothetical protein